MIAYLLKKIKQILIQIPYQTNQYYYALKTLKYVYYELKINTIPKSEKIYLTGQKLYFRRIFHAE